VLWWRTRRSSIKIRASWFLMRFDAHRVIGIYTALFLFVAGVTGVLIGFDWGEEAIYATTKSEPPDFRTKPPQSTPRPARPDRRGPRHGDRAQSRRRRHECPRHKAG
jgi:uncharacterized iron-regulated membrane protein